MIRFIKQAREAIVEKRIEDRFNLLVRASNVVLGLQSSLDFEHGGHVASVLFDFYSSVDARILTIQRSNDVALCDALVSELKEMREAWAAIDCGETQPAEEAVSVPQEVEIPPLAHVPPPLAFGNDIVA
jgi:flagellar protein FliS